jgi:hypothetical protein
MHFGSILYVVGHILGHYTVTPVRDSELVPFY